MPSQRLLVRNAVFWVGFAVTALTVAIPNARYFIYLLPFLVSLAVVSDRATRFGEEVKPFITLILAGMFFLPFSNFAGSKDLYFILTGISVAFLIDIPRLKLWNIFLMIFICSAIYFLFFGDFRSGIAIDIEHSYSSFEGKFGFLFALVCPFALIERRYKLFFLSMCMTIISLKRIAVLAVIVSSIFVLIGERRARRILNPPVMVALNILILATILLYAYGAFDDVILAFSGQSANQLGQGRRELLTVPATEIILMPERFILFGHGPGSSYAAANAGGALAVYGNTSNMHSDVVKIFYEYGFVLFVAFIWKMYASRSFPVKIGFLFLNIIFITDNALIYSFMLFLFFCCARHADREYKQSKDATFSTMQYGFLYGSNKAT